MSESTSNPVFAHIAQKLGEGVGVPKYQLNPHPTKANVAYLVQTDAGKPMATLTHRAQMSDVQVSFDAALEPSRHASTRDNEALIREKVKVVEALNNALGNGSQSTSHIHNQNPQHMNIGYQANNIASLATAHGTANMAPNQAEPHTQSPPEAPHAGSKVGAGLKQAGKGHITAVTGIAVVMGAAATGTALLRNEGAKESFSKGIDTGKEVLVGGVTAVMDGARKKNDGTLWSKVKGGVQGAIEHMAPEMKDGTTCQKAGGATKVFIGGGSAVVLGTAGAVVGSAVGPGGTAAGGLGGAVAGAVAGDKLGDKVTLACEMATYGINAINRAMMAHKPTTQTVASNKAPDSVSPAQATSHGREGRS